MSSRTLLHLAGRVILLILLMAAGHPAPTVVAAAPVDELSDLTGRASAIATLKVRDNFANQFEYDVTVRNLTSDPLKADSLVVVVENITDLAGKDATDRVEVVGFDGYTKEGKPYFRVPVQGAALPSYGESQAARVLLRNPYYTILFTPSFKVRGLRSPPTSEPESITTLLDLLIKKGVMTPGEGAEIRQRTPATPPLP